MNNDKDNFMLFLVHVQIFGLYAIWKRRKRKRWINRRWWVGPINTRREEYGDFTTLLAELKEDRDLFFRYTRMDVETFYELLEMVRPYLQKNSLREPICPEQRLTFRVRVSTAHKIIKETCDVITSVLMSILYENYFRR
ncbi:uncharacterized protein LOC112588024 isoform X3 [Harpegnathos saltator]|uniref:uncharacterized protein LOC112588024 isoform X3 n=1 Tax=Harpegnathos saltator TaxID=610380 RepID=UPI000DBEEE58|nr:uncharacterized protein LOC112588024 isoform X3 [Harpegnathos saltator]